ncbi:MAG: PAS domain S-box protein [FCB group bacterium]|nr:PAS domain S-box protein [FCB group bacterium]
MNVSEELLTFRDSKTKTISTSKSRFIDNSGKKFIIGVIHDITERKQLEDERQKFVMLAESSSEFIGMCDLDFRPVYVNPAGRQMVGLPDMEAACRVKVQDYFFPEDQQFITEEFFPWVFSEGEGDVEIRLRHFQTGEAIWMAYYLNSVLDAEGQVIGWATVSRDITEKFMLQKEIEKSRDQLRLLSQQLISVREQERTSLALELHDGIGQALTALNFDLDRIQTHLTPDQTKIGVKIEEMIQLLRSSIGDVQRISGDLRPRLLDELGLDDAILWYANDFSARSDIEIEYINKMAIRKVDGPRSIALFRIMQEALTNVARHAEATKVTIGLGDTSGGILMKIADDGVGIQLAAKRRVDSIGLVGMEERTLPFGGTFKIEARKSGGTLITVILPDNLEPL